MQQTGRTLYGRKKKWTKTTKKIIKTIYEVVVLFNDNSTETIQDKLTRIMLRELQRKSSEKKIGFWLKSPWQVATSNTQKYIIAFLYSKKAVAK